MEPIFALGLGIPPQAAPWLALAGLGAFHGVNPAMGWLFAVALGLHRDGLRTIGIALLPIALGHAASVIVVAAAVLALGAVVEPVWLQAVCAAALLGWAGWHALWGHRGRVRYGMTTGLLGLGIWSFLMASAHGAGLMLTPALMSLCLTGAPAAELTASGSAWVALAAIGVHTAAMLAVIGAIAVAVHQWIGLAFLRHGWINLDLLWSAALGAAGLWLLTDALGWI
ncbi:MAG: hypothetical protein AAFW46_15775 [Pseudomonadota bacterium]